MSRSTKKENLLFCIVSTLISTFGILLILKSNGFYPFKEVTLFICVLICITSTLHFSLSYGIKSATQKALLIAGISVWELTLPRCMPTILQALFPG
mgnify:CR=1 FL=1